MKIMGRWPVLFGSLGAAIIGYKYFKPTSEDLEQLPSKTKTQWKVFNIDGRPKHSRRIVAVGDIHGDHNNMLKVLKMSNLINEKGDWIAGKDIFVNTGDCVDRGHDTIDIYNYLIKLQHQAKAAGGAVELLLGNHEVMNAMGDWRYVTSEDIASFGGTKNRQAMMSDEGWIGKAWLSHFNATARIPLSSAPSDMASLPSKFHETAAISAVHGGIRASYAQGEYLPYPAALNTISLSTMARLLARLKNLDLSSPLSLPRGMTTNERSAMFGKDGIYWYRGYAQESEKNICKEAHEVAKLIGVRRLVMGHTPQNTITSRCDGRVWLIDTGISKVYGGLLSALVFNHDLYLNRDGKWVENEVITALHDGYKPEEKLNEWRYVEN